MTAPSRACDQAGDGAALSPPERKVLTVAALAAEAAHVLRQVCLLKESLDDDIRLQLWQIAADIDCGVQLAGGTPVEGRARLAAANPKPPVAPGSRERGT